MELHLNCSPPILDIVLPVHNEAKSIRDVLLNYYNEIATKLPSRLIVAEDGSTDGTRQILEELNRTINMSLFCDNKRKGFAKGVRDALKRCDSEWVFFSDADGQYSPSDFWQLWENREYYDIIIGHKVVRNENIHRLILAKGFHAIANNLFQISLHDADCGFRLIRKNVIDSVIEEIGCLPFSYNAEFTIRSCLKGFRVLEVPISHFSRRTGQTQIYTPSKIPLIIAKQLRGLAELFSQTRKDPRYNSAKVQINKLDSV
jgi:dolichol-phosphate mannosyltransferase